MQAQVADFTHTCFMVTPYEEYVAVAEQLNELTPGSHDKRSALFNSGAEAVENAVKIARSATGRTAVVAFDHAYHGRTNLTMALTAKNMPYKHHFGPFAGDIYRVPMAYPYRWPTGPEHCADEAFAQFVELVHAQVGEDNCAAVLIEPIQGEGGFVVPAPGFLARVADWCADHGIVFVADEIQTGFCRTGDWFACDAEGVVPDLITTAKGIAGGLPLAARHRPRRADGRRARRRPRRHVRRQPGRLRRRAGRDRDDARRRPLRRRPAHRVGHAAPAGGARRQVRADRRRPRPRRDARRRAGRARLEDAGPALTAAISAACHQAGLITLTAGTFGNVLRFLPPLVIGEDLLHEGLDILDDAFAANA